MELQDHVEAIMGRRPARISALHGGNIGEVYRVEFSENEVIVAKAAGVDGTLDIEGYMLRYLQQHSQLPVPEVLYCDKALLLMSFIEGTSDLDANVQHHAAELLADLHRISATQFGLEQNTLIGSLLQPNPLTDSWIEFFREHRLLYMAQEATNAGILPGMMLSRIEKLASKLGDYLIEPKYPSLIHGDMWTTNILATRGKVTGFIDPAIYYAHPEIELAFSTLFGTFGKAFFERYHELNPIEPGFFEERRDIYNLYPLLVHVRLFGGGYILSVDRILHRFGF